MDYQSEVAIECIDYQRHGDGTGGTAVIEVPTVPRGLMMRISGVELLRLPPARPRRDEIVPLWSVHFPAGISLESADRNKFRTAVMAAVVRYEKALELGGRPPAKPKASQGCAVTISGWPEHLTTMIQ